MLRPLRPSLTPALHLVNLPISFRVAAAAGSKGKDGRRRGSTDGGVAGRPFEGGVGSGADSDDDAWFDDIQKKNKRRDKALWGGSDEEEGNGRKGKGGKGKGKGKKGDDSDEEDGHKKGGKGGKGKGGRDPFLLGGGKGGREAAGECGLQKMPVPTTLCGRFGMLSRVMHLSHGPSSCLPQPRICVITNDYECRRPRRRHRRGRHPNQDARRGQPQAQRARHRHLWRLRVGMLW